MLYLYLHLLSNGTIKRRGRRAYSVNVSIPHQVSLRADLKMLLPQECWN
jgi:hypothetical protein